MRNAMGSPRFIRGVGAEGEFDREVTCIMRYDWLNADIEMKGKYESAR
jgi:hypothetical protein